MDLRITQTWPKIGIETQKGTLSIANNNQIGLSISHTEPQIQMNSTPAKIYIDQTQCFADAGRKNNKDFAEEKSQMSAQNVMDYIGKMSSNGDRLAKIEQGGKRNLEIIHEEQYNTVDYNIGLIPQHRPEINAERGDVNIEVIKGKIDNQYEQIPLKMQCTPTQVNIYLLQKGSIDIEYVGKNIDTKI
jgi:hypothetical protein